MFVFKAAVVGAGTMGGEIAQVIAAAGIPVVLKDIDPGVVDHGLEQARQVTEEQLAVLVAKGKITPEQAGAGALEIMGRIHPTTSYDAFGDVDFVIEAVPEQIETKQDVFAELDGVTPGHAILASNTSSLSVTEIGDVTSRPDKVVGFHFLCPVSVMRLVEVVEGEETSPETAQAAANFAQAIRRLPIRCGDVPGFVVNRILNSAADQQTERDDQRFALRALVEACLLLEQGVATIKDIDLGMMAGAGIVPPPFARADAIGLDQVLADLERAQSDWGDGYEPPLVLRRLVAQGRLGQTSGQGFFPYARPDAAFADSPVALETRGDVAIAWLSNPPANSLSPAVVDALGRVWATVDADPAIRALVITSANPQLFCAGADIKAFTKLDDAAGVRAMLDGAHDLLRSFGQSSTVTIAAVNAVAFGGGCELAMACDIRIAAESATFGQPEINLGIIPGFGGTQRLPRLVGPAKALEMNLTGDAIGAAEACEFGLVNAVVADHELLDTALLWGRKLAAQAPVAVEQIKRVSHRGDLDEGIEAEKDGFAIAFASDDAAEGIGAFLAKRMPRFQGK